MAWLGGRFQEAAVEPPDLEALTLILIESMAAYRELDRVFGEIPGKLTMAASLKPG